MADHRPYSAYDPFAWYFNRYWAPQFARDVQPILSLRLLPRLPQHAYILDLCCGSGQLCKWLSACGFAVTGLDGSREMLRYARRNAPKAELIAGDARCFRTPERFDAVISLFDSLNHLSSREDLLAVFENVRESLRDGGLFFFDMNLEEAFQSATPSDYAVVKKNHVLVVESTYHRRTATGRASFTIFRLRKGAWRRLTFEILEYAYPESDIVEMIEKAGFRLLSREDAERDLSMPRGAGRVFFLAVKENEARGKAA
jgi:SAM-dependent methyltransferase